MLGLISSPHGLPLVLSVEVSWEPTVTVELYQKWYSLYLVSMEGDVAEIPFEDLEDCAPEGEPAYIDHAPNPKAVLNYAKTNNYEIDSLALEIIVGRWYIEAKDLDLF